MNNGGNMKSQAKYHIVPKRDFGNHAFLIDGEYVKSGFVVTFGTGTYKGCNAMPGATWSRDISGAIQMIKVFEKCGGDTPAYNNDRFWKLLHRINGATRKNRDMSRRLGIERDGKVRLLTRAEMSEKAAAMAAAN